MEKCKICGSDKPIARLTSEISERDNRAYCHDCFISIMQAENLLNEHASRMFMSKKNN